MASGDVTIQVINMDYEVEGNVPHWIVSGREKDRTRWDLRIYGDRVIPSFGVPYEEYWKIHGDNRIVDFCRGPDSPFGEPVMHVVAKVPEDIGGNRTYKQRKGMSPLRDMVSHSYQGDIKFEKKIANALGIWEGYMKFDGDTVEEYGYLDDNTVRPLDEGDEKFHVDKLIVYWDTEWNMEKITDKYGRVYTGQDAIKEKKYEKCSIITIVFLESYDWTFHAFTWHPRVKKDSNFMEEHLSRISEKAREKIPRMPAKYDVKVHAYTNEKDMLMGVIDWWSEIKPDANIGFNAFSGWHGIGTERRWINAFDMPWFYRRCLYLKLPVHRISPLGTVYQRNAFGRYSIVVKLVTSIDLWHCMAFFKYHQKDKLKNEKLDTFMDQYLGIGKVIHEGHVWEDWMEDPKHERWYCQADVEGTAALTEMFRPHEDMFNRAMFAGAKWEDGMSASKLHDQVNLHLYLNEYYLDTKYQKNEEGGKWTREWLEDNWINSGFPEICKGYSEDGSVKVGGYNPEPRIGMWRNVAGFDFNKFYPMSAIGANAGPETYLNIDHMTFINDKREIGWFVVDKRPYLKMEVENWDAFIEECRLEAAANAIEMQDVVTDRLIGWKYTYYRWDDVIWTASAFYNKEIVAKNVKAFWDLLKGRKDLQKIAKAIWKMVLDPYHFDFMVADQRQFSFKGFMNGRFGVQGMEADRLFMLQVFNTITLTCQIIIRECVRYMEQVLGYEVVLGATDSFYVPLKHEIKWIHHEKIDPESGEKKEWHTCEEVDEINDIIQHHVWEFCKKEFNMDDVSMFTLECENISDYFWIRNKKFYMMHWIWKEGEILKKPKIFYKGLKKVRRETAALSEKVQEECAEIMMTGGSVDEAARYVKEQHDKFGDIPIQDLSKVLPVKKPWHKYSESSEQYKAFRLAQEYFGLDVKVGDRYFVAPLKYCPNTIKGRTVDTRLGDVIAFDETILDDIMESGIIFDYGLLESRALEGPLDEILVRYNRTYWDLVEAESIMNPFGDF